MAAMAVVVASASQTSRRHRPPPPNTRSRSRSGGHHRSLSLEFDDLELVIVDRPLKSIFRGLRESIVKLMEDECFKRWRREQRRKSLNPLIVAKEAAKPSSPPPEQEPLVVCRKVVAEGRDGRSIMSTSQEYELYELLLSV